MSGVWESIGTAGRAVVVKDGMGKVVRFFHLDRIDVKEGQKIKQGDFIGTEGASGKRPDGKPSVTGPHLHLEIGFDNGTKFGKNESKIDPASYVVDVVDPLKDAIEIFVKQGILQSPDYWLANAVKGKTVNGEYAATMIIKAAGKLRR